MNTPLITSTPIQVNNRQGENRMPPAQDCWNTGLTSSGEKSHHEDQMRNITLQPFHGDSWSINPASGPVVGTGNNTVAASHGRDRK